MPLLADKLDATLPHQIRGHRDFRIETDAGFHFSFSLFVPSIDFSICRSLSPAVAVLHLLSHLYVQRSLPLWKEHSSWFSSTVMMAFPSLPSSLPITEKRLAFLSMFENVNLQYSVYRHILVLETSYKSLFSFIPRKIFEGKALACDPLPPPASINYYDQNYFQGLEDVYTERRGRRQRAVNQRALEDLLPDPIFRQQFQV